MEVEVQIRVWGPPEGEFGPEPIYGGWGLSLVKGSTSILGSESDSAIAGNNMGFEWSWGHAGRSDGKPRDTSDSYRIHGVTDGSG